MDIIFILYCLILIVLTILKNMYLTKMISNALTQEVCLDSYINLCIYYSRRVLNTNEEYNYFLCDIANGYMLMGEFERAKNIYKFLETRKLDNVVKAYLIEYKATIAFSQNDVDEFQKQYKLLENVLNSIPNRMRKTLYVTVNIKKNIIENNIEELNKIFEELENSEMLLKGHFPITWRVSFFWCA